jgi:Tfp pilus assembly protein PilN
MRAVNLIPREARRGGLSPSFGRLSSSHLVIALLAVAVAFVTAYVLTSNAISSRQAHLASVKQELSQMQAAVARLQSYEQFEKLAQARAQTVQEIANSRFDWHGALSDLSKVVPTNTTLQSLVATVSSGTTTGGAGGAGGGSVRGDIDAPAFQLKGCTASQDEVAQLMSRLRVINGVTRVTLEDSSEAGGSSSPSTASAPGSCSGPTFDLVVFFQPVTGGTASTTGQPASTTTPGVVK